jgi:hypothetical protein
MHSLADARTNVRLLLGPAVEDVVVGKRRIRVRDAGDPEGGVGAVLA